MKNIKTSKSLNNVILGCIQIQNIDLQRLNHKSVEVISSFKETIANNKTDIISNLEIYQKYFSNLNSKSPLEFQFNKFSKEGLTDLPIFIKILLFVELTEGLLMGVQNLNAIENYIEFDNAKSDEQFVGMKKVITCQDHELVVRDSEGIIASVLQVPDEKTKISSKTNSVVFYIFGIKDIPLNSILSASKTIDKIFSDSCENIRTTLNRIPIANNI